MQKFAARVAHRLLTEVACLFRKPANKVFFDHLPKCGGTSLNRYLDGQYPFRRIYSIEWPDYDGHVRRFKQLPEAKRHAFGLVRGHRAIELIDHIATDMKRFTIVREPIDRVVSGYFYAMRDPKHHLYKKLHSEDISLHDYIANGVNQAALNGYVQHFARLPAADVAKNPEAALKMALETLNCFDLVGILEKMQYFPDQLQTLGAFSKPYSGKRHNVTANRPALSDIPPDTLKLLRERNAADIEFYNAVIRR